MVQRKGRRITDIRVRRREAGREGGVEMHREVVKRRAAVKRANGVVYRRRGRGRVEVEDEGGVVWHNAEYSVVVYRRTKREVQRFNRYCGFVEVRTAGWDDCQQFIESNMGIDSHVNE